MPSFQCPRLIVVVVVMITTSAICQSLRDGRLFDPGVVMEKPASGAPEELGQIAFAIGQWDVLLTTQLNDSTTHTAKGRASISWMNRGHALMERFYCDNFDGRDHELSTMSFLTWNPGQQTWLYGDANSFTESISMLNGDFDEKKLVLKTAIRRGGGAKVTFYRLSIIPQDEKRFRMVMESSPGDDQTWKRLYESEYQRRSTSAEFLATRADFGAPAEKLPAQAREFDFLIGDKNAFQEITFPNGQVARFPSKTSAVFALNGHGILEFNYYDVDPNLPDAGISIIRIYNRAMRRWESLYLSNRGNGMLFFGGKKEGDRMVLHNFEVDRSSGPISHYVFFNIGETSYSWYAESSNDWGKSFTKTWTIEVTE